MESSLEGPTHCIFISSEIRAALGLCKKIRASSRSQSGRRCDVDQRDLPHCEHYSQLRAAYSIFPGTLNPGVRFLLRLLGADRVCAALAIDGFGANHDRWPLCLRCHLATLRCKVDGGARKLPKTVRPTFILAFPPL